MKRIIIFSLVFMFFQPVSILAEEQISNNDLLLKQERVQEEEQQLDQIGQLEAPLFSARDQKRLQERRTKEGEQLALKEGQLFSGIKGELKDPLLEGLFEKKESVKVYGGNLDVGLGQSLVSPQLLYLYTALGVMMVAAIWSYKEARKEEEKHALR